MKRVLLFFFFFLSIFSGCGQFSPTQDYIANSRGDYTIEVPEVQELVHIIIALTPTGKKDKNMVLHDTQYYDKVVKHFRKHESHNVVKRIDQLIKNGRYAHVKMDACGFYFNERSTIIKDKTYRQLNWSNENYVETLISELEKFSKQTGFRKFYQDNQHYYDELIRLMEVQVPVKQQWRWLEERFPNTYDHYRITFSPLVNGAHSTNRFETDDFKQTVMFVSGPITNSTLTDKVKEGLMSRVVFTEIDHNYVNPISDQFKEEIIAIFNDRTKWTSAKDSRNYGGALAVFNEYMTWSVFNLYAYDTFEENDFKLVNERVEVQMVKWRGFPKFKEFNQKLIALYKNRKPEQSIIDLYPLILRWCKGE